MPVRIEHDLLGDRAVPGNVYYGVHTLRAFEQIPVALLRRLGAMQIEVFVDADVDAHPAVATIPAQVQARFEIARLALAPFQSRPESKSGLEENT